MSSFKHSGDAGDVVQGLCAMKVLGGGTLYLAKEKWVRQPIDGNSFRNIAPLFERQPYVKRVLPHDGRDVRYNLDLFRSVFHMWGKNGCEMILKALGQPEHCGNAPWLEADSNPVAEVVINLTLRYRNRFFPWHELYAKYGKRAVFVGAPIEHWHFTNDYGPIPYMKTDNYLELANVINGAKLFIGNQSSPLAIATGLGKQIVCEVSHMFPTCRFQRSNFHCSGGSVVTMPDI